MLPTFCRRKSLQHTGPEGDFADLHTLHLYTVCRHTVHTVESKTCYMNKLMVQADIWKAYCQNLEK